MAISLVLIVVVGFTLLQIRIWNDIRCLDSEGDPDNWIEMPVPSLDELEDNLD